jgi:hypothetical protein
LPEENEQNIRPARPVRRWWPGTARTLWVWPFGAGVVVGFSVLLLVIVIWQTGKQPAPDNRLTTAPAAAPSAPAGTLTADPAGSAYTIFAWRDGKGALRRAAIDTARYDEFVATTRRQFEADQQSLAAARTNRLRAGLAPLFDEIDARVSGYADWAFNWWTSWILLARTFGWTWDGLTSGSPLTLPDRVQTQLVAAVQEQFIGRVVEPLVLEPKIDAALHGTLAALREDLLGGCARYQQAFADFVRREAQRVERQDPAQGWIPDPLWDRGGASFQRLCDPERAIDDRALHAEFPVLLELKTADSPIAESPVNDVILRLARPFATKLISFIVLPVIIAAILGGILLPLFSQLPGVLANVITGVLTGALGALIIGFAASASVDWILNRTDAALNRAGFEATVRKAIISVERDFETRVLDAQQRSVDRQLQALATAMAGKVASP